MFNSPEGSLESIFVNDYAMIDQYAKTGSLWMWGDNIYGQLGDGTTTRRSIPVQTVAGGTNWKQNSLSELSSQAIKTDGTLWTWGWYAEMPNDPFSFASKSSPVLSTFGDTFWKEVNGNAAIKTDGTLWLWGSNLSGELGNNNYSIAYPSPPIQTVSGGTDWKTISSGNGFKLAIKTDGTLWTWGEASYGQLGNNAGVNKSSPVQTVAGGNNWKQVSGGYFHSAGIKTDGTLWTWGRNTRGELGDNTVVDKSSPVQTVAGGTTWKQLASGYFRTVAIKTDGTLWNWGSNSIGQLGDNTVVDKSSPVQTIAGGTNWKQVTGNSAAIKTDGTLWLWGINTYGNIGDNTTVNKSSPVQTVVGGTNWKKVTSNFSVSSAIHFYDAGNLYPGGGGGAAAFSATVSSNQTITNLRTQALGAGWDGSSPATITIGSGVYVWSDSTSTAAITIDGSWPGGITLINNGFIMGKGGAGGQSGVVGNTGGPAISLGVNATIVNNSYIGGGGGGGGAGAIPGGGGGAGGGAGGGIGGAYYGGSTAGGGIGSAGSNGSYTIWTGDPPGSEGAQYVGLGGGGGRIFPGSSGAAGYGYSTNTGGAGGGAGGGGGHDGGWGTSGAGAGGAAGGAGGNGIAYPHSAGGGGWGAAGGTSAYFSLAGGAGGKAIALNGYTATTSGSGTIYGSVS